MHPRKLLVFSLFFSILFNFPRSPLLRVRSENLSFDFPSLSLRNLTLLGDSYLRNGVIGLTRELTVPSSSSGSVIYNDPIPFYQPESNTTSSFSTRFSFSITNINPASFGDGLTFFLSPDNQTLGSSGGYLGLVNSSRITKNKFVAIEFDTKKDAHFDDPNDNHVGLDIKNLVSMETANPDLDLKSGKLITAWIDYKSGLHRLNVFLSYSSFKPNFPLLSVDIDLSDYLKDYVFVGFSASTEGSTELHMIENWSFHTYGFRPTSGHNVSDSSVIGPPIPDSPNKHHRRIGLALGIAGPAFFCAFLVIFGWVSVRKWRGVRMEKSFKAELMTGPRQFNYRDLKLATRGFHSGRIVGRGAFGTVYKACFQDSDTVFAVKRSKHNNHEDSVIICFDDNNNNLDLVIKLTGKTEFIAELSIIACLRHKNLVQLQGWCVEKGELLLVYEFMPNGSLDKAEEGKPDYIAKIVELFETINEELYFSAQWFYRAADTVIQEQSKFIDENRVFYSGIRDDNPLGSIEIGMLVFSLLVFDIGCLHKYGRYIQVGNAVAFPVSIALGQVLAKAIQGVPSKEPVTEIPVKFPFCLARLSKKIIER
ncbi:hypothetical protein RHGRI_009415 [Rhododendron griersonianum]|uniref:Uncharacterized protein n=1 Tax=Rhododendron griersonianum TaxID=479676 RepID=A0AAV6KET5_9ERIC|nr:hypothetical protein RHGRI_009415 [Rhododendron griersonianum]